jgi:hypothetical protein
MADDADYHRTFEPFSMGMWPVWKYNKMRMNYRGQQYYKKMQEDEYAESRKAFYAHQKIGKTMTTVRVMPKYDQRFADYATPWETAYSSLTPNFKRRVEPVVDEALTVVGHLGWFRASEILIPVSRSATIHIQDIIDSGDPIFALEKNPLPTVYRTSYIGQPEWKFLLLTGVDGAVLGISSRDVGHGATSTTPPWEIIGGIKGIVMLAKGGAQMGIKMLGRRGQATRAVGPTREAAEKVATTTATAIPVQAKKVSQADMLNWEKAGGHGLHNHGPQLTRETLKKRITGGEKIPAPQAQPGGYKPPDFRVWKNQKEAAASKWASDDEMRQSIGEVLNKNIAEIRKATGAGGSGEIVLRQNMGRKTGEGWVASAPKGAEQAAMWDGNLKGVTIVIRRRANHVPSAKDPEGWYVHTAFPDRGI